MNISRTDNDIVLSSRIRLARNVEGYNFTPSMSPAECKKFESRIYDEISSNPFYEDFTIYNINELDELDRIVLKEKKIISQRYYRNGTGYVITDNKQQISIITGDLDHFRISAVLEGLNIDKTLEIAGQIERELAKQFQFASFNEDGYLTVNVTDSGTAMKGSIYLHLPVLCASELMDHYIINTIETMLEVTGFSGGGAHSLGGFYIISNKNGFYPDQDSLTDLLKKTAGIFIEGEHAVRKDLMSGRYPGLEDRIFRSYGTLKYCRQISELEAISALSMVRLGIAVNWIESLTLEDISIVLACIGNGYIRSIAYARKPDETDIMRLRADIIRKKLNFQS